MYNVYRCIDHTVLHMLYFIVLNMTLQKLHYIVIYIYSIYTIWLFVTVRHGKIHPFLRTVNHLFLWAIYFPWLC